VHIKEKSILCWGILEAREKDGVWFVSEAHSKRLGKQTKCNVALETAAIF